MDAFLKKVDDRIKKIKANNKETKQSTEDKKLSIEDKAYAKAKSRKIFQILLDELANLEKAKTIYKVNEKKIKFHIKQIQTLNTFVPSSILNTLTTLSTLNTLKKNALKTITTGIGELLTCYILWLSRYDA